MNNTLRHFVAAALAAMLITALPGLAFADESAVSDEDPEVATIDVPAEPETTEATEVDAPAPVTNPDVARACEDDASGASEAAGEEGAEIVPAVGEPIDVGAREPSPALEQPATQEQGRDEEEDFSATAGKETETEVAIPDLAVAPQAVTAAKTNVNSANSVSSGTSSKTATASKAAATTPNAISRAAAKPQVTVKAASVSAEASNPAYAAGYRDGRSYLLASGLSGSRALSISGNAVVSAALTRTANQFWKAVFTADGYVKFISESNGLALGVSGGKAASGAKVGLFASKNALSQMWLVAKTADGAYTIVSALSGKTRYVLDVAGASKADGAAVQLYKSNGTLAQKWKRTDVTAQRAAQDKKAKAAAAVKGSYSIASKLGEALSLTSANANASSRTYAGAKAQKFTVQVGADGYATIKASDGKVLDVAGAKAMSGTNVQFYASNGTRAQKWIVSKNSDGAYKLESALWPNLVLDVVGASKNSGANVQVYNSNGTNAQKWDLVKAKASVRASDTVAQGYYIFWTSAKKTLCLDVAGAGDANGTKLQLYTGNGSIAQRFRVVKKGSYYRIEACTAPGKRADLDNGLVVPGTKAQIWNSDSNNSLYSFQKNSDGTYRIVNVASGLALGTFGGAKSGAAVKGADAILGSRVNFYLDKRSGLLDEGIYNLKTVLPGERSVTVTGDSWASGAKLEMDTYTKSLAQKWYVKPVSGETNTYTIESLSSGMRLSGATNGNATQSSANGKLQRWIPQVAAGNAIVLKNALTGKALDVSGASTAQGAAVMNWTANGTNAQKWNLAKVAAVDTGIYEFKLAAASGKSLDVDVPTSNVQVWSASNNPNQRWYYDASKKTLMNLDTGKMLDVSGGSKASGANVKQYASNGSDAQKWTIKYDGSGRFKLVSSLGKTLVLTSAGTADGKNVTSSTDKGSTTQRWRLKQASNNKPTGFNLITSIISNGHGSLNPSYIVIHETANPGATAKNHRDYWKGNDTYAVHYVVDWTGNCYYCVPEDRKCWQVGNGNPYVVGIELCHATNKSDFNKVWNAGVEWARWQLAKRGWGVDRLISHYDCTKKWGGSDHTDPIGYFNSYGKSWSQFKNDVAKALARGY